MDYHQQWVIDALDKLEMELPDLIAKHPDDGDFWCAFSGIADDITDHAGTEEAYAHGRIDCMLKNAGMIPGEDEGEPCN